LLKWLTTLNYGPQQSDFISKRQPGTGEWLLNSTNFQDWLTGTSKTLYCPGIPGAGKTIMASVVVNHLETIFKDKHDIGIAYVYCNYQPQQEQKPEELLLCITKQLLQLTGVVPSDLEKIYTSIKAKEQRPDLEQTDEMLKLVVSQFRKVFVIVDALDEYYISDNSAHNRFVAEMLALQRASNINIFATSRPVSEINALFAKFDSLEIRAQENDIVGYINGRLPFLRCSLLKYPNVQDEVRKEVVKAADGMYEIVDTG
jgi:hypothetical protein